MPLTVKKTSLSGGVISALARFPIRRDVAFRYNTSIALPSSSPEMSRQIISGMHDLEIHHGAYDWKGITSYGGAVYSALQKVDRPAVNKAFPDIPKGMDISLDAPVTWGGLIFKVSASAFLMSKGLPAGDFFMFDQATDFWKTGVYLGLNAARNALSDLISKHGVDPKEWASNLHHIKWDKLTDSMLITALCYPILYGLKETLHQHFGGGMWEPFITSAAICTVDASLQYFSRKLRGFDRSVAIKDTLRPVAGDLGAFVLSLLSPAVLGNSFLYLLSRKVFAESYSGYVEGNAKRQEKHAERKDALNRVLDISRYHMPENLRYGMAAVNLVYLTSVKSVTKWLYRDIVSRARFSDEALYMNLIRIHKAMEKPGEIAEAIRFLFPFDDQAAYREQMFVDFLRNRGEYKRHYFRTFHGT